MTNIYGAGVVLLFIIHHAISDPQSSNNILSSLYKKAASENRPMILVLDSENKLTSKKDLVKTQSENSWVNKLLQKVKEPHQHGMNPMGSLAYHKDLKRSARSEKARERDRQWLRSFSSRYDHNSREDRDRPNKDQRYRNRSDRDRRDRDNRDKRDRDDRDRRDRDDRDRRDRDDRDRRDRDDRDRRDRYRDDDRRDKNRDYDRRDKDRDYDRRDKDRDYDRRDRDRRDRDRDDRYDDRDDDRKNRDVDDRYDSADRDVPSIDRTLRQLIEKTLNKSKDEEDPHTKAIQTSVIKHLLRANNYFNCDAQDKCKSKCPEKPKNNCNNKCEQKFECEPEPKNDCDECQLSDSCGGEDDGCNPSTRGVPYEEEPVGCKRC